MVCCVPGIPLCLSEAFWGLDPTYFQGPQGGIKADWGFWTQGDSVWDTELLLRWVEREGPGEHNTMAET